MTTATTVSTVVHLVVGAAWAGGVLFFALGVLPVAGSSMTGRVLDRFTALSRGSALLMLLTGGHLAGTKYGDGALTGTDRGLLVLAMLALWLALIAVLEVANARVEGDTVGTTPTRLFQFGALLALLLLLDAGLLASGAV